MAVGVINLLEIVQVQREDGQGMPLALRPSDFRGQALLSKTAVVKTRQWINHGQIAEKVGMALFLGELTAKALDENLLRDRIDVKDYDQTNQSKDNFDHLDPEDGIRSLTHRGESERYDCKDEKENDKDRIAPEPPVALFDSEKFVGELLIARLQRRRNGLDVRNTHGVG